VTILHLLDILVLHIDWLKAQSETAPYIVYPLLRIASEDRVDYEVRKKLIFMCLNILEKFSRECSILGRDLVRCLIEVYQIDEFQNFWYRLLNREKKIETMLKLNLETINKPSFDEEREGKSNTIPDNELMHLLQKKASINYIKMRIAPQMESDINFIIHELGGCNNEFHINLFIETYQPRCW
jgi:hypothetical protein